VPARGARAGEAEGLRISFAAAQDKLAQADNTIQRRNAAIELGMPGFSQVADRTVTLPAAQPASRQAGKHPDDGETSLIIFSQRRDRDRVVAPEPAGLVFDDALLMRGL
jgi:hypothetical protein